MTSSTAESQLARSRRERLDMPSGVSDKDLERLLHTRVSCRAYRPEPVPRATIDRILEIAQWAPSWCNSQAWQVHITSGAGTERLRNALYEAASAGVQDTKDFEFPREYTGVYLERRRESGFQLYNALGIPRGDKERYREQTLKNFQFFGAPHVAIVTTDEALGPYGAVDCGGYVTAFMLAATACGVGTVAQAALAHHPSVIKRELGIGSDRNVVCGISFGFPDPDDASNGFRTTRAVATDVVDWIDE